LRSEEKFMIHTNEKLRAFGPLLFTLAAVAGVALGACKGDDNDGDESGASLEVRNSCEDYCERAVACDDERNRDDCNDKCIDRMTDCQVDEQTAALDKLAVCSNESCDDFFGCTVNVGAQCIFGLD
jgi:hypothetical protein